MSYKFKQSGMSILELMVALAIFSIILIAVVSLYINSNYSYTEDERAARLQENGRFALNMIAADLTMVDFWGEMLGASTIDASAFGTGTECNADLRNGLTALLYYDSGGTVMDAGATNFDPTSCTSTLGTIKANTNVLLIKRVDNAPDTTPSDGIVYLRTNGYTGAFIDDAQSTAAPVDFNDWAYMPHMYFIRDDADGVPYLCRATLVNEEYVDEDTPTSHTSSGNIDFDTVPADCLAEGVEQLYVEFGVDDDGDGAANQYISNIDADQAEDTVSARIYLLVRSDADTSYNNDKTYQLGHAATLGPYNDNYYRRVFTTTVDLRNPRAYILLNK